MKRMTDEQVTHFVNLWVRSFINNLAFVSGRSKEEIRVRLVTESSKEACKMYRYGKEGSSDEDDFTR
jgi:hypothetical protein